MRSASGVVSRAPFAPSWTCEKDDNNPHFVPIANRQSYIANLSGYGIQHRMLFHLDTTNRILEIAPVGRYQDRLITPYDVDGKFHALLPFAGARISGNLAPARTQLEIEAGRVTYSDGSEVQVVVTGVLLNPLP